MSRLLVLAVLALSAGVIAAGICDSAISQAGGLIPPLQSWIDPISDKVSCSSSWANVGPSGVHGCAMVFDRQRNNDPASAADCWITLSGADSGWVRYQFDKPTVVSSLALQQNYAINYVAENFVFQGSVDGFTDWTDLYSDKMARFTFCAEKVFTFDNQQAYLAYRVSLTNRPGGQTGIGLCEIQMFGHSCTYDGLPPKTPQQCDQAGERCFAVWNSTVGEGPSSFECRHTANDPELNCVDAVSSALQFNDRVLCGDTLFHKEDVLSALNLLVEAGSEANQVDSGSAQTSCAVPVYWRPALDAGAFTALTALPEKQVQWSVFPELPVGLFLDPVTGIVQGSALVAAMSPASKQYTVTLFVSVEPVLADLVSLTESQFTKKFKLTFPAVTSADCTSSAPLSSAAVDLASSSAQVQRWCASRM